MTSVSAGLATSPSHGHATSVRDLVGGVGGGWQWGEGGSDPPIFQSPSILYTVHWLADPQPNIVTTGWQTDERVKRYDD